MTEKVERIGDLDHLSARDFANLCTFLPDFFGKDPGDVFNDLVDGTDPAKAIKDAEAILRERMTVWERVRLERILDLTKCHINQR